MNKFVLSKNTLSKLFLIITFSFLANWGYGQIDSIPGNFEKAYYINSKVMNEGRTIWISAPSDYNTTTETYPVLYLLDAGNHFKYVSEMTSFLSGYDRNRIPKLIVVGICNIDRGRDFTPVHPILVNGTVDSSEVSITAGAGKFLKFIKEEIIPFVDKNYRTQPYRILVGHSLGGLFAFYVKEAAPSLFQSTILISPAINGVNDKLLSNFSPFLIGHTNLRGSIFIGIGNENTQKVDALTQELAAHSLKNFKWDFKEYDNENHFSVPYKAIFDGLKFIYADWFLDYYSTNKMIYRDIADHFQKLSNDFGYSINPDEEYLNNCGYQQLGLNNIDDAIDIFKQNVIFHPKSFNAYDSLGEAYKDKGDKKLAIENYKISLSLNPNSENGKEMLKKLESGN